MVDNRIVQLGGVWAQNAVDPPLNPIAETTYADSGLTEGEIQTAWPYRVLVDGAKFNEFLRRVSTLIKLLEINGIMPWSHLTTYVEGSHCLGSNGKLYRAIANARTNVNRNPVSSPAFWVCDTDVEAAARAANDIPSGTVMLFQQSAAPTGWTKNTTHNNKALRVVNGVVSAGGTQGFSTIFSDRATDNAYVSGTVGGTALTVGQLPSHAHNETWYAQITQDEMYGGQNGTGPANAASPYSRSTGSAGSGQTHSHTFSGGAHAHIMAMGLAYVDIIIATKN